MKNKIAMLLLGWLMYVTSSYAQDTGIIQNDEASFLKNGFAEKIPVKVVVITLFEKGKDSGDAPGEFQYWVEKFPLRDTLAFPQGYRTLRYNREKQVLGICTGMGTARSSASIMALGMDPRFDFSHTYWLVAGISGIDPADGTVGSAVWAEWLVDGDLAHEIDAREMPAGWSTGYIPLGMSQPYEQPASDHGYNNVYHLNGALTEWAFQQTKDIKLLEDEKMKAYRAKYTSYPKAQQSPRVMKGDHLAAMRYWHGAYQTKWANEWVKYWTNGKGNFVTSAMEDTGTAQALQFLSAAGLADFNRFLVLRSASNFTMQYPGSTAVESLRGKREGYTAFLPSLDAAYRTGKTVIDNLLDNWAVVKDSIPAAAN